MNCRLNDLLEATLNKGVDGDKERLRYHVRPVAETGHYFGRANDGSPCLLLASKDGGQKLPIRLAALEVSFAIPCRIAVPGEPERTETLSAIICSSSSGEVHKYFAHVCETILAIVGPAPKFADVTVAVRRLVDLFQKLATPSLRSVIGLFGELFFIDSCPSSSKAVVAWRSADDDRFDFSVDDVRLEVKASSTRQRAHSFSLEQCSPPPGTRGVLVSLFVESSGGGMSLLDLVERIQKKLEGDLDLVLKLQGTVAEALGSAAPTALAMRFDDRLARSSMRLYDIAVIPAIRGAVPAEVTQVRFRSDLSRVRPGVSPAGRGALLRDLLPQIS